MGKSNKNRQTYRKKEEKKNKLRLRIVRVRKITTKKRSGLRRKCSADIDASKGIYSQAGIEQY